jgi:hypothetical protein
VGVKEEDMAKKAAGIGAVVLWLAGAAAEARAARTRSDGVCDAVRSPEHIRVANCGLQRLVATGLDRSPTFRELVGRVSALDGVVYVATGLAFQPRTSHMLDGLLSHRVVMAGSRRLTFVTMGPSSGDRAVATLAHELQHVIELLESDATSPAEIDKLFQKIGFEPAEGRTETEHALEIQRVVLKELTSRAAATSQR